MPDHFGVSNLVQILLVTEKLNIFVLLVAHLGTAERGGRNVVSGRNVVRSILPYITDDGKSRGRVEYEAAHPSELIEDHNS